METLQNYQRHLTLRAIGTEDFAMLGDADSLALDQMRDHDEQPSMEAPTPAKRGRKRKIMEEPSRTPLHQPEQEMPQPMLQPEESLAAMMPSTPLAPPTPLPPQTPYGTPPTPLPPQTPLVQPMTPLLPHMTGQEEMHIPSSTPQGLMPPPTPQGTIQLEVLSQSDLFVFLCLGMMPPATPQGMMYPQTPGYPVPSTPLQHIEDMPHLPADQVALKKLIEAYH